ncbi:hypothetical protein J5N97_024725 [Dioscorea zingiberensis]|uniref:Acyl carrier protein n=1 Tax=Dioscorea zingiberensis TaxID=325984 RepID=A0A9D5C7N8_9LILI|nr:hypothetical protein J5N97_024725 [Dioscorea zingiberensis]
MRDVAIRIDTTLHHSTGGPRKQALPWQGTLWQDDRIRPSTHLPESPFLVTMQHIKASVLRCVRLRCNSQLFVLGNGGSGGCRLMCRFASKNGSEDVTTRVIELVKKFDKLDASKVTETADFQKDLSLDSLDRVELVMAFEQEFSIEIPDATADKLKCCADVVEYILSESHSNKADSS